MRKYRKTSISEDCNNNLEIIQHSKPFKTVEKCHHIGKHRKNVFMYKYMDIETAILCIKGANIRFVEPTQWQDKYESRFYTADYTKITTDKKLTPRLYACCFTFNKASEAAWRIYSYQKTGIASRCVQFRIKKQLFREALNKYAIENDCEIYEGPMNYDLDDYQIDHLHFKDHIVDESLFNTEFTRDHYLSLLLIKRSAFYYENEYRFFITPNKQDMQSAIYPVINWSQMVDQVFVDKDCSDIEIEILTNYLVAAGININPVRKNLNQNPDKLIKFGDIDK